uniref:BHLH domain-containing protein n=1 Tax=Parascaris univalens TaxID=6257 RepID=A0A915AZC8_PARUN
MMSYQSPAKGRHSIANKLSCGHQKSPYQVQRRNERERRRVHQVISCYHELFQAHHHENSANWRRYVRPFDIYATCNKCSSKLKKGKCIALQIQHRF